MMHAAILPILIPLAAALLQLTAAGHNIAYQRGIAAIASVAAMAAGGWLLWLADSGLMLVYALGDWPAPFGIVLVADRMAAIVVMLSTVLAAGCLLYACAGFDTRGKHFHPLFQLQLVGINGAFLTGDLFNLFVFFEVLLLASYILLAHGGGFARSRAGISYVVLNLVGSAIFLVALGLVYGTLGTLNLADVAVQLQQVDPNQAGLIRLAGALLVSVFALKAAMLPMSFWLPLAYSAAGAPVAALFVIMSKVGVYAILRIQFIALAPAAATADLFDCWLLWAALSTQVVAALGVLAATRLQALVAWLVLSSAGLLLIVPAMTDSGSGAAISGDAALITAGLYYLVQSTLMAAAFFMLADMLAIARRESGDQLTVGRRIQNTALGIGFFVLAATAIGLPPFSGFLGKLMLLSAVQESAGSSVIWGIVLASGFIFMVALARAGSRIFWEYKPEIDDHVEPRYAVSQTLAVTGLTALTLALTVFAGPVTAYIERAAVQVQDPSGYISTVLGENAKVLPRQVRP